MLSKSALWRNPDFMRLWTAQGISAFGARITREGLPITAVLALGASPATLGVLAAMSYGPALVVGLAGGGFIDGRARRPVLIAADLIRAAVLVTVPIAAWLHLLALPQIFLAAALVGAASVLFDMADHAYLPGLIGTADLVDGNSKLSATESVAEVAGPALAGLLFQWLTAPIAVAINAVTYLVSAAFLAGIGKAEPPPSREDHDPGFSGVTQGIRLALAEPRVRPLFLMAASNGLFGGIFAALYVVFAIRTVGLTPSLLGLAIACGGVGALAGAVLAPWLGRKLGVGPAILFAGAGMGLMALLIPLAPANRTTGLAFLVVSQLGCDALGGTAMILGGSLRQTLLPQAVLGRVSGAFHAVGGGTMILGALGGGLLGEAIGPRLAMLVTALGLLLAPLIGVLSPLRGVRTMEAAEPA